MKRIIGYQILVDGRPARLGLKTVHPKGVVVPAAEGEEPHFWVRSPTGSTQPVRRQIGRIIGRTLSTARRIRGSVVFDWPAVQELCRDHEYTVKPIYNE